MEKKLTINCDGGSRGNPGKAAAAFVVSEGEQETHSEGKYLGVQTNNFAEYQAVIAALKWLQSVKEKYEDYKISFILDSELVVRQLTGVYKIKNETLKNLAQEIKLLEKSIGLTFSFENVLRHKNKTADFLVNRTLDEN